MFIFLNLNTFISFAQNPQADLQAQDRCHRIGQTKPVVVYRLMAKDTIDQRIIERAQNKRRLEKLIIRSGLLFFVTFLFYFSSIFFCWWGCKTLFFVGRFVDGSTSGNNKSAITEVLEDELQALLTSTDYDRLHDTTGQEDYSKPVCVCVCVLFYISLCSQYRRNYWPKC
jgi:hypothetical protein